MTQRPGRRYNAGTRGSRGAGRRAGKLLWTGVSSSTKVAVAVGAQIGLELLSPTVDVNSLNGVIRRIIGQVTGKPQGNNLDIFWRLGLTVMAGDALAAAAFPDPWADPAQWMHESTGWVVKDADSHDFQFDLDTFDTKVMRKLGQSDNSLVAIFENLAGSGGAIDIFQSYKVLYYSP